MFVINVVIFVNVVYVVCCSCNREREKFIKAVSIHCLGLLERYGYSLDNKKKECANKSNSNNNYSYIAHCVALNTYHFHNVLYNA